MVDPNLKLTNLDATLRITIITPANILLLFKFVTWSFKFAKMEDRDNGFLGGMLDLVWGKYIALY